MTLAEKIRKRREELNLSQTALGQKVWLGSGAPNAGTRIRRFEAGQKPKVHEIKALADALELDPADLLASEYGPTWSEKVQAEEGIFVSKMVLDQFPGLEGILQVLNASVQYGLTDIAKQAFKLLSQLGHESEKSSVKKSSA